MGILPDLSVSQYFHKGGSVIEYTIITSITKKLIVEYVNRVTGEGGELQSGKIKETVYKVMYIQTMVRHK